MMTLMTRKARRQAPMKRNLLMNTTVTSLLGASRESRIQSSGGMRIKRAILVFHVWQRTISLSQVSIPLFLLIWILNHYNLAASVAVERVFSKGRLLLSHIRNRMSAHSTRALLCLGAWSKLGYVDLDDLNAAASLPDVGLEETWSDEEPECNVVA
jgi:hypothetical protein